MEITQIIWLAIALGAIIMLADGTRGNNYADMLLGVFFFFYVIMHLVPGDGAIHRYAALFFSLCILCTGIYKAFSNARRKKSA